MSDGSITVDNAERIAGGKSGLIPHRKLRESLSVGNSVQLGFRAEANGRVLTDRLWLVITRCHHDGRYTASVQTPSSSLAALTAGALVEFGPEHIFGWEP